MSKAPDKKTDQWWSCEMEKKHFVKTLHSDLMISWAVLNAMPWYRPFFVLFLLSLTVLHNTTFFTEATKLKKYHKEN